MAESFSCGPQHLGLDVENSVPLYDEEWNEVIHVKLVVEGVTCCKCVEFIESRIKSMRGILYVKGSQVNKNIGHFLVILKKGEVSPNDLTSLNIFNSKIVTTSGVVHEYRILDVQEISRGSYHHNSSPHIRKA